jgi:hypothetical protein
MTYVDSRGSQLATGDIVRAVLVPDHLDARNPSLPFNTLKRIINNYGRIANVSTEGLVEFEFRIRFGHNRGLYSVWLEPYFLQKKKMHSMNPRAVRR